MIKPTVGRVVWYWPGGKVGEGLQPCPAMVCYVWNERMVNLAYFDANGKPGNATSVTLCQEGDPQPLHAFCEWMPFQIGQAKTQFEAAKIGDGELLKKLLELVKVLLPIVAPILLAPSPAGDVSPTP